MYSLIQILLLCLLVSFGFIAMFGALFSRFSSCGIDSIMLLLERLLNVKARHFLNSALHTAVRHSHPLVIEFLLRLQADCDARNLDGDTALLANIRRNSQQNLLGIMRLLLTRSNPSDCDKDGNTAHHLAVQLVDRYDVFEELTRYSTEFEKVNSSGLTVLQLAVKCENHKAIKCLLQHNADMHKRAGDSKDSKSALELAEGNKSIHDMFAKYMDKSSRCLDVVDNMRDPDPAKRFSAYTTPANMVHIRVGSELPYFTHKGLKMSVEGDRSKFHVDMLEYPGLTYAISSGLETTRDFPEDNYCGPPLPPINLGNSVRAIWLSSFMLLCHMLGSLRSEGTTRN